MIQVTLDPLYGTDLKKKEKEKKSVEKRTRTIITKRLFIYELIKISIRYFFLRLPFSRCDLFILVVFVLMSNLFYDRPLF